MRKIMLRPEAPYPPKPLWLKISIISLFSIALISLTAYFGARVAYQSGLRPVSADTQKIEVIIDPGTSVSQIGQTLKEKGLIRSTWAYEWYIRLNKLNFSLKAGVYELSPNQGTKQIVGYLVDGKIAKTTITILPGKRIDQVRRKLIEEGFPEKDVESALSPNVYPEHPALIGKPVTASLEGYLFPETFEKTSNTKATDIVKNALNELNKQLTPQIKSGIERQGLTTHQAIILASIVEREAASVEEKKQVAQVLLLRFKRGIKLEADPTAFYGAIINGAEPSLDYDSPYNTYLYRGLPEGPIGNFGANSLAAVANPAPTEFLFFVAGKDCITRFSKTDQQHEELKDQYGVRQADTECPSQ